MTRSQKRRSDTYMGSEMSSKADILIRNAAVMEDPAEGTVQEGCVAVSDGLIAYVGPEEDAPAEAGRVIDAKGALVMPGFYDMHTHLPMNLLRGYADDLPLQRWLFEKIFPAEAKMTDEMAYWATLGAACELVRAGIVCVADMYDHSNAVARAVEKSGIRAVLSRGVVTRGSESWQDKIDDAEKLYLDWNGRGRIRVWFSPHGQYTNTTESIRAIGRLAEKYASGIHTHISETRKEHEDCIRETGMTPAALYASLGLMDLPFLAAHCVWITDDDIHLMADKGAACAACPRSNLKLGAGFAPLARMRRNGMQVALGTDSAASNNRLSIMSEMECGAYVQKTLERDPAVFPAEEMIVLACDAGPRILGENGGALMPGMNADLIMISMEGWRWNPGYSVQSSLVYAAQDTDVVLTMVGGDVLYESGVCTFVDEEEVKERLRRYAVQLSL